MKDLTDAEQALDNVQALRKLMAALDNAAYALSGIDAADVSELSARLVEDATLVMQMLERIEASPAYQNIRKARLLNPERENEDPTEP